MSQDNQNTEDNELQKAIDSITKGASEDGAEAKADAVAELEAKLRGDANPGSTEEQKRVDENATGTEVMSAGNVMPVEANPGSPSSGVTLGVADGGMASGVMPANTVAAPVPGVAMAGLANVAGGAGAVDNLTAVKISMLRDLFPLMGKIQINNEQKYKIYRQMILMTHDKNMIPMAYNAVREIEDEVKRAEALLFLVEEADK